MANYRSALPQLSGDLFLTDAGLETDLIFNHGIEIQEFAAHTLLPDAAGREALANYFRSFLRLACEMGAGFILDSQTWKAHMHWANDLRASADELRAADSVGLPIVVSFTVETDGNLPTGQPLGEAIQAVDEATESVAAYFMVNCAHPDHFSHVLEDSEWVRRIRGLRCNASRKSHADLDESETLDDGDPIELGSQYKAMLEKMPWVNVFGGCCGSDLRHVTEIARAVIT